MELRTQSLSTPSNWKRYTLVNDNGMEVTCLNYGGIITKILAPDQHNHFENVVLGYKNEQDYLHNPNFFGALIGRVAGRIQNSTFSIDGTTYELDANEGPNHLHGGANGFDRVIWDVEPFEESDKVGLTLTHTSPDGEGGYPGTVQVQVTYTLTNDNQLQITYDAQSDKKTALTLTNHSYFNLSGDLKQDILHHDVTIDSSHVVELDDTLIPTGNKLEVEGTVFDFRNGRQLKDGVSSSHPQNQYAGNGYDHNFIFDKYKQHDIVVRDETSGRQLTVDTEQPGFVMYTSNNLDESLQLSEGVSKKYLGVCLETQGSPASLEHQGFPSIVLDKDQPYRYTTTFTFGVIEK
ncbi:aldose epimerase family protein [Aquibacillus sediminis]|uniref:aldose epimerase family protein n=1 Tax=Aquibacillus sediminis TaxID=2574734 RepID=UPI00110958D1|nr:aldose epimerase family protein [Aquibacillus sediminis]